MDTLKDIEAMDDQQAQTACEAMAMDICGTDRFKTDLAERIGYTRAAVNSWFAEGGRPPTIVLMYLRAEIERDELARAMKGFSQLLRVVDQYA
tara:strand:+ start:10306 stop:10584 length:279 start_codon:yes stop_codon:yes gene_type:complete